MVLKVAYKVVNNFHNLFRDKFDRNLLIRANFSKQKNALIKIKSEHNRLLLNIFSKKVTIPGLVQVFLSLSSCSCKLCSAAVSCVACAPCVACARNGASERDSECAVSLMRSTEPTSATRHSGELRDALVTCGIILLWLYLLAHFQFKYTCNSMPYNKSIQNRCVCSVMLK